MKGAILQVVVTAVMAALVWYGTARARAAVLEEKIATQAGQITKLEKDAEKHEDKVNEKLDRINTRLDDMPQKIVTILQPILP